MLSNHRKYFSQIFSGTRRNTGEIHEFKKGAFHMAIQGQVPILPVVFSSYQAFLNDELQVLNPGEIVITVLPEILTTGLTDSDIDHLMKRTHQVMTDKFLEVNKDLAAKAYARCIS